jgi:hypothetical protein
LTFSNFTNEDFTVFGEGDDRWGGASAFCVGDNRWLSTFEYRYAAICCSEVDSDCSSHFLAPSLRFLAHLKPDLGLRLL